MASLTQVLRALAAACILALVGCGGGGGDTASQPPTPAALYGIVASNLDIANALYLDSQRTPPGFYADPAPPGQDFVDTLHIRSSDVAMTAAPGYELCSDDWNQALQWSEAAAGSGAAYGNLVGNSSTARYFEFDRVRGGTPAVYVRQRVYLCSYLDRSAAAPGVNAGAAGLLNLRPISASDLRLLSEYLWRFTSWNNYGSAVLASEADPLAPGLAHTLVIATLSASGVPAGCDRIDVAAWRHQVDGSSGVLSRSLVPLWSFNARQGAAGAEACGG